MKIFWKIRYLDSGDRQFKDRELWLDTATLEPERRFVVETIVETQRFSGKYEIIQYRNLFVERPAEVLDNEFLSCQAELPTFLFIPGYIEDETGQHLSDERAGQILTGYENAMLFWPGTKKHDMELHFAEKKPIALEDIEISPDGLQTLGVFAQTYRELASCAFLQHGKISMRMGQNGFEVATQVSGEELRSFVAVFRQTYMCKEPSNFVTACTRFSELIACHPLSQWVREEMDAYRAALSATPDPWLFGEPSFPFSRKRVINVFLYTRYIHQPDQRRSQQYAECLESVGGDRARLKWLFLTSLLEVTAYIRRVGPLISNFVDVICEAHQTSYEAPLPIREEHPGIGSEQKSSERIAGIVRKKADAYAHVLWVNAGSPEGGPAVFLPEALKKLSDRINFGRRCEQP